MRQLAFIICLIVSLCFTSDIFAASGKCGANLRWELDSSGLLKITGEGRMNDYGSGGTPWRQDLVKYVEFGEGVTSVGKYALAGSKITAVVFPSTLITIGECAFNKCEELASVELPFGVEAIEKMAFANCKSLGRINIP